MQLRWQSACLACAKPWVCIQVSHKLAQQPVHNPGNLEVEAGNSEVYPQLYREFKGSLELKYFRQHCPTMHDVTICRVQSTHCVLRTKPGAKITPCHTCKRCQRYQSLTHWILNQVLVNVHSESFYFCQMLHDTHLQSCNPKQVHHPQFNTLWPRTLFEVPKTFVG